MIRNKDTKPELDLRRMVHGLGYRYRLSDRSLPGTPDLVFRRRRKVIFVNGCFWHVHDCKWGAVTPATNTEFWANKRGATVLRDSRKRAELEAMGWQVLTVWECELKNPAPVVARVIEFLGD